jgi:hypothetical protein
MSLAFEVVYEDVCANCGGRIRAHRAPYMGRLTWVHATGESQCPSPGWATPSLGRFK